MKSFPVTFDPTKVTGNVTVQYSTWLPIEVLW